MSTSAKPAKKPKKQSAPPAHPTYAVMIAAAIGALKERSGSSRQAILKYIKANYKVGDNVETVVRQSLPKLVKSGALTQPKGKGASGSFKLGKTAAPKKKAAGQKKKKPAKKAAAKKPAAKKAAKQSAKKAAPKAKKPAAKKSPAKKSSKKAAAPKKKPAKKASKAKKQTTKKAAKKPAAKKSSKK